MTAADSNKGPPEVPKLTFATMPQRYAGNRARYQARGGLIQLEEDARGFLSAENNKNDMSRYYFFCLVLDLIAKESLKGDFAELGVYKGHTAGLLATMARRLGKRVYLFDTFSGFNDADLKGVDGNIPMSFEDTSIDAVRAFVGDENVTFVQGYFPSSAKQIPVDLSFSLVHLDCDLYAPMSSALAYFYPRLAAGGFLIIHDYSSLHWSGVEKAVDEFFATRMEAVIPVPDSAGSIVIRKASSPTRYDNWYVQRNAGLLSSEWTSTGDGNVSPILGDGWSHPESWGVWGVNEAHQFHVFLSAPPVSDIELEFDVAAKLYTDVGSRKIAIFSEGRKLQEWEFTDANNRAVRPVRIPQSLIPLAANSLPVIELVFRPDKVIDIQELQSRGGDQRHLGIALHRVRRIS
jgi:hypothetical protein